MNKELLIELFSADEDLINTYHISAPNTVDICAERTLKDLELSDIHLLKKDDKIIGYYGIRNNTVTGFFIIPEYRNKETLIDFWDKVNSHFSTDYYCGLYNKNTRAIDFIRKVSVAEFPIPLMDGIFFKIKR